MSDSDYSEALIATIVDPSDTGSLYKPPKAPKGALPPLTNRPKRGTRGKTLLADQAQISSSQASLLLISY